MVLGLLLASTTAPAASAARTAAAPPGGPSANNTVTKIQSWLEDQVSVSGLELCFFCFGWAAQLRPIW